MTETKKETVQRRVLHQFVRTRRSITSVSFPSWRIRWQGADMRKVIAQAPKTATNLTQAKFSAVKKQAEEASNN